MATIPQYAPPSAAMLTTGPSLDQGISDQGISPLYPNREKVKRNRYTEGGCL